MLIHKSQGKLHIMQNKQLMKMFVVQLLGISLLFLFFLNQELTAQEVDPFYLRVFRQGQNSFLKGNYKDAIKKLEVALFGINTDKKLMGKGYILLALSHDQLKNGEKREQYLKEAFELMGDEGFINLQLNLNESMMERLKRLLNYYKLEVVLAKEEPAKAKEKPAELDDKTKKTKEKEKPLTRVRQTQKRTPLPKPPQTRVERAQINKLERDIRANPRNAELYYELYELHMKSVDIKACKKTLQKLLSLRPAEIKGRFHLAKLHYYYDKNYRAAEDVFKRMLKSAKNIPRDDIILVEAYAYLILSVYFQGDRERAQKMISESTDLLSEDRVHSLSLNARDKAILQRIKDSYQAQIELERQKKQIKKLERLISKKPQDPANYIELYTIFLKQQNHTAAKKVVQRLLKSDPGNMRGRLLFGKVEFLSERYNAALPHFNLIIKVADNINVDRELTLKAKIYLTLCYSHLNQKEKAKSLFKSIQESTTEGELTRMMTEEALSKDWEKLKK